MIRITGHGSTYDPKTSTVIDAIAAAVEKYQSMFDMHPTHVSIPKFTSGEDKRMIKRGLGLKIANATFGMPLIIVGVPMGDNSDSKKQGKG